VVGRCRAVVSHCYRSHQRRRHRIHPTRVHLHLSSTVSVDLSTFTTLITGSYLDSLSLFFVCLLLACWFEHVGSEEVIKFKLNWLNFFLRLAPHGDNYRGAGHTHGVWTLCRASLAGQWHLMTSPVLILRYVPSNGRSPLPPGSEWVSEHFLNGTVST